MLIIIPVRLYHCLLYADYIHIYTLSCGPIPASLFLRDLDLWRRRFLISIRREKAKNQPYRFYSHPRGTKRSSDTSHPP